MWKKRLLLVLSILFLIIGCVAWFHSCSNLNRMNDFHFTNSGEGESVSYITESDAEIKLYFAERSVRAENSYLLSDRKDRLELCAYILYVAESRDIQVTQGLTDLMGELAFHNLCYRLGIAPEKSRSADLEYCGDTRFAVWFPSKIIGVLGF